MIHDEASDAEISVDLRPADEPRFVAVVRLRGEHDLATGNELRAVLAWIDGNVLVDLAACEFIDSTVISVLISSDHERAKEGQRLELRVPKAARSHGRSRSPASDSSSPCTTRSRLGVPDRRGIPHMPGATSPVPSRRSASSPCCWSSRRAVRRIDRFRCGR